MERRTRALWCVAIPTAVSELLAQQTVNDALGRAPEVRACCERAAVDTWLDFAFEERLRPECFVPVEACRESLYCRDDRGVGGVGTRHPQQLSREQRR